MNDINIDDMLDPVGGSSEQVTFVCFVMDHSGSMSERINEDTTKDHSGSMSERINEDITKAELAKSNFEEQLVTLRKETDKMETRISVIEFDDAPNNVIVNSELRGLLDTGYHKFEGYWTGGMTALYDSIGMAIKLVKEQLDAEKRKDKSALIVIQTDGMENASKEYKGEEGRKEIKKQIEELENTGLWTFTFLGENIDTKIAGSFGIKVGNSMSYDKSASGYKFANISTVHGIKTFYDARKAGMTQTANFHDTNVLAKAEEEENVN